MLRRRLRPRQSLLEARHKHKPACKAKRREERRRRRRAEEKAAFNRSTAGDSSSSNENVATAAPPCTADPRPAVAAEKEKDDGAGGAGATPAAARGAPALHGVTNADLGALRVAREERAGGGASRDVTNNTDLRDLARHPHPHPHPQQPGPTCAGASRVPSAPRSRPVGNTGKRRRPEAAPAPAYSVDAGADPRLYPTGEIVLNQINGERRLPGAGCRARTHPFRELACAHATAPRAGPRTCFVDIPCLHSLLTCAFHVPTTHPAPPPPACYCAGYAGVSFPTLMQAGARETLTRARER